MTHHLVTILCHSEPRVPGLKGCLQIRYKFSLGQNKLYLTLKNSGAFPTWTSWKITGQCVSRDCYKADCDSSGASTHAARGDRRSEKHGDSLTWKPHYIHALSVSCSHDSCLEKSISLIWCLGQRLRETGCGRQGYSGGYSSKSTSLSFDFFLLSSLFYSS